MREQEFTSVSIGDTRTRPPDLEWIEESFLTFWTFASESFHESGRGAIALGLQHTDLEERSAEFFPMLYVPSQEIPHWQWKHQEEILQLVNEYRPNHDFIMVLMKGEWEHVVRASMLPDRNKST